MHPSVPPARSSEDPSPDSTLAPSGDDHGGAPEGAPPHDHDAEKRLRDLLPEPRAMMATRPLDCINRRVTLMLDPAAIGTIEVIAEMLGLNRSECMRRLLLLGIEAALGQREKMMRRRRCPTTVRTKLDKAVAEAVQQRRASAIGLTPAQRAARGL